MKISNVAFAFLSVTPCGVYHRLEGMYCVHLQGHVDEAGSCLLDCTPTTNTSIKPTCYLQRMYLPLHLYLHQTSALLVTQVKLSVNSNSVAVCM